MSSTQTRSEAPPWLPPPRYLLRKHCVLKLLRPVPTGRVLEIGPGAGDLLATLASHGYIGLGLEISAQAAEVARRRLAPYQDRVRVLVGECRDIQSEFDLLIACDVLEHIREDEEALRSWVQMLAPRAYAILSVPAHRRRWDASDEEVGHYRRYERHEIVALAERCGLAVERLWCYGFPLSNVTARARALAARRRRRDLPSEKERRSAQSGLTREGEAAFLRLLPSWVVMPFCWLQMLFVGLDIGTGYVVRARRHSEEHSGAPPQPRIVL